VGETEKRTEISREEGELENLFHSQSAREAESSDSVDAPPDEFQMLRASTGPDIDLYGSPPEVRRSQRPQAPENDLESDEMVFSSLEIENPSTENELGEQSFSGHAQNILTDLSQL